MKTFTVDEYISQCPEEAQVALNKVRACIQEVAPQARERTDYFGIPGYSLEGYDYDGVFAWFSYKQPNLRIHVRPPVIQNHEKELAGYKTTKAIVSFPVKNDIPYDLVKKLVRASIKAMKDKKS